MLHCIAIHSSCSLFRLCETLIIQAYAYTLPFNCILSRGIFEESMTYQQVLGIFTCVYRFGFLTAATSQNQTLMQKRRKKPKAACYCVLNTHSLLSAFSFYSSLNKQTLRGDRTSSLVIKFPNQFVALLAVIRQTKDLVTKF